MKHWSNFPKGLPADKGEAVQQLRGLLDSFDEFAEEDLPSRPELDAWVAEHFAGQRTLGEIVASLRQCSLELKVCADVFQRLSERSPTALALTLKLLRANEGRPLPEVFAAGGPGGPLHDPAPGLPGGHPGPPHR